jgi:hypothetical protein
MAVNTGMQFVKTFALIIPILLTEYAKRMKAPQEAKAASSIIGRNILKVNEVVIKSWISKIRNSGRKRTAPIRF